jgi:hypothetical protein
MKGEKVAFLLKVIVVWQEKDIAPLRRQNNCSLPCLPNALGVVN